MDNYELQPTSRYAHLISHHSSHLLVERDRRVPGHGLKAKGGSIQFDKVEVADKLCKGWVSQ